MFIADRTGLYIGSLFGSDSVGPPPRRTRATKMFSDRQSSSLRILPRGGPFFRIRQNACPFSHSIRINRVALSVCLSELERWSTQSRKGFIISRHRHLADIFGRWSSEFPFRLSPNESRTDFCSFFKSRPSDHFHVEPSSAEASSSKTFDSSSRRTKPRVRCELVKCHEVNWRDIALQLLSEGCSSPTNQEHRHHDAFPLR